MHKSKFKMSNPHHQHPFQQDAGKIRASSVSPVREFEKLRTSLARADAANRKARPRSHSPLTRTTNTKRPEPQVPKPVPAAVTVTQSIPSPSAGFAEFAAQNLLKEEYIYSYDYFQYRIQILLHKTSGLSERVIVLFTANDRESTDGFPVVKNKTWCKDCNYLESIISKFKSPKDQGGYLVRVKVGTWEEWMSPSNPYRLDKVIRLKSIPTIMVWGTEERLAGRDVFDVNQLVAIFDEGIEEGDPWRRN